MPSDWRSWRVFLAVAALFVLVLLRDAILHGYVLGQGELLLQFEPWRSHAPTGWRPGNPLLADSPTVFYPFLVHARKAFWEGTAPLWNSSMGSGMPFFAAFQSAVLSPFTIPGYLFPLPDALTIIAAARLLVGGIGMFVFLRTIPLSGPAAAFGGIAYLLNPFSIVWLEHPLSAVAAWVPWLLLAAERGARTPGAGNVALVAAITAAALLSGHPETMFKVMLLVCAYAVYRAIGAGRAVAGTAAVAGGVMLAALICAVQLLPFLEYAGQSRVLATRSTSSDPLFTIPAAGFVTAFVPDFFGNPTTRRYVLAGANYCEQQIYPGIAAWILAAAACATSRHRARAIFFLVSGAVAALIMYGTPLAALATAAIPPLRVAALSRFGLLTITGVVVAAALAVDRLLPDGDPPDRRDRVRMGAAATLAAAAIAVIVLFSLWRQYAYLEESRQLARTIRSVGYTFLWLTAAVAAVWSLPLMSRCVAAAVLIGIVGVDLLVFADGFHPLRPRQTSFPALAELQPVHDDPGVFRVTGLGDTLMPNSTLVYGLHDFRGYDGVGVRHYGELLDVGFRYNGSYHSLVNFATPHLLDLLNVKYILAPADVAVPADRFTVVKDGAVRLYRNERVLPRAFLADSFVVLAGDEARRALRAGAIDFRRTVVLEAAPPLAPVRSPDQSDPRAANIRSYEDHRVVIDTRASSPTLLVLSDTNYPGWTSTIDGAPALILRANFAFRAVAVPAGTHVVEFRYRPRSVVFGLGGSVAGLLMAAGLAARHRFRTRISGTRESALPA